MNPALMNAQVDDIVDTFMEKPSHSIDLYIVSAGKNHYRPGIVFKKKEDAIDFVNKLLSLFRSASPDWEYNIRKHGNTFVIVRRNRWFLMKYDDVILTISIKKTWGIFSD